MKVPLLDLKAQYAAIRQEVKAAMDEVCDEQSFILGPKVEEFEKRAAEYCGVSHAVGVSSGTDALLLALMATGIGPGDGVVTTPYTFFATAGSVVRLGATPVFVDIDPATYNMDPEKLAVLMGEAPRRFRGLKLKALIPIHLFGQAADMDPLMETARKHGLKVVEDAAQAIGTEYPSRAGTRKTGAMGDAGCFSFFPSKNLGGFGDGGMVTTNDPAFAEKLRVLRNHGAKPKYYHETVGGNFRLDAIQAAILNVKLRHLERWHEERRRNAARYDKAFDGTPVGRPAAKHRAGGAKNYHVYNQYVVRVPERDLVMAELRAAGVGCEVYYPLPLHLQKCFASLGFEAGSFPESERAARESLALPIYPELTAEMQEYVVAALLRAVKSGGRER